MIEALSHRWLLETVTVSWQFTILTLAAALVVFLLRGLGPHFRYIVWVAVLSRLAIPFGIESGIGLFPGKGSVAINVPDEKAVSSVPPRRQAPPVADQDSRASSKTPGSMKEVPPSPSVATIIFFAWASSFILLLGVTGARAAVAGRRIRRAGNAPSAELTDRIEHLRLKLGLRRPVRCLTVGGNRLVGPVIQGVVRLSLLVPDEMERTWKMDELDAVLLHELIHLRRRDPVIRVAQNVLQMAYFFHPLVWFVNGRIREEREKACDHEVVSALSLRKEPYLRSLLHYAERPRFRFFTPELGVWTTRHLLARRLERMLAGDYRPVARRSKLDHVAVICGVTVMAALLSGRPAKSSAQERRSQTDMGSSLTEQQAGQGLPTIRARVVFDGAYFVDSVDEVDGAERFNLTGDFTAGRLNPSIKPDAERLAEEQPELWARLAALQIVRLRALVDHRGRVVRPRFETEVDEDIRQLFLETIESARIEPTRHFRRGPVIVDIVVDYLINPKVQTSLHEPGEELLGDEVGEILQVIPASGSWGETVPERPTGPAYSKILDKPDSPVMEDVRAELFLSFIVDIASDGGTESAQLFSDSRVLEPPRQETAEAKALLPYILGFQFTPVSSEDGSAARAKALVTLRVSSRGVDVATRAPVNEEEWERRLVDVYRLQDGRVLDLLPPPYPPERMHFYRARSPGQARAIPSGPDMMTIVWSGGRPVYRSSCFGCRDLKSVLMNLGFRRDAVRFIEGAENLTIEADILMREGAGKDELLRDLEQVLWNKFGVDLDLELRSEIRPALVLRGSIGSVAEDPEQEGRRTLHVFTDKKNEDPRAGGGGGPFMDTDRLVSLLERHLAMPVVDETTGKATHPFHVRLHRSSYETKRYEELIRNLEAQTDLEIQIEQRPSEVVAVTPNQMRR